MRVVMIDGYVVTVSMPVTSQRGCFQRMGEM